MNEWEESMNELRELLAALAHEQWAHWTRYMLARLETVIVDNDEEYRAMRLNGLAFCQTREAARAYVDGMEEQDRAFADLERWRRQVETPYADLTEEEKAGDREWADRYLAILGSASEPE